MSSSSPTPTRRLHDPERRRVLLRAAIGAARDPVAGELELLGDDHHSCGADHARGALDRVRERAPDEAAKTQGVSIECELVSFERAKDAYEMSPYEKERPSAPVPRV